MQLADHRLKFALTLSRDRTIKSLLLAEFFLLTTTFSFFDFGGRNLLFIGFTVIAGIVIVAFKFRSIPSIGGGLMLLVLYLILSFFINVTDARVSSFFYSLFFLLSYWFISSFFKGYVGREDYVNLLRFVFVAYFFVLILGQLYVSLGFFPPVFNLQVGPVHDLFGTLYEPGRGAYRFYSLSTEPSCAAFVVVILFYSYMVSNPERNPFHKKNIPLWIMLCYMIYYFKSGYGVILLLVLFIAFLRKKESFIPLLILGTVALVVGALLQTSAIERVSAIVYKLDPSNIFSLKDIDYSASFRILPVFHYLNHIDLLDFHFYLGYGAGTSSNFLIPLLFGSPVKSYEGGFLPQFLYDYGILILVFLALFLRENAIRGYFSYESIVILLMMTNANFNTQLFWITIVCFALNKYYSTSVGMLNHSNSN